MTAIGVAGTVFLPESVAPAKLAKLRLGPAAIELVPGDGVEAELAARRHAEAVGQVYVSPYNDLGVVAGQGTIGVELLEQWPDVDVVLVTVGGGGLASGIAAWLARERPGARVIGCLPRASAHMAESVRRGQLVQLPFEETLSDGSAGALEPGALTFPLCRELIHDWILIDEDAIAEAMATVLRRRRQAIEGAAGVAVAAWLRHADRFAGENVAVVICGGNVSLSTLKGVLTR